MQMDGNCKTNGCFCNCVNAPTNKHMHLNRSFIDAKVSMSWLQRIPYTAT